MRTTVCDSSSRPGGNCFRMLRPCVGTFRLCSSERGQSIVRQTNKQTNIENTCILSTKHYIVNYLSVPWICCDQMLCNASGCKKIPLMTNSPLLLVAIESDVYFDGYAETGQLVCVGNNTKDSTYICFSFTPLLHRFSPLPYFSTGWNSQYLYCISCESHYLLIPHFPILFPNKPVMV